MKFFSAKTPVLVVLSSLVAVVVFGEDGVDMGATTTNDATAIAAMRAPSTKTHVVVSPLVK